MCLVGGIGTLGGAEFREVVDSRVALTHWQVIELVWLEIAEDFTQWRYREVAGVEGRVG